MSAYKIPFGQKHHLTTHSVQHSESQTPSKVAAAYEVAYDLGPLVGLLQ